MNGWILRVALAALIAACRSLPAAAQKAEISVLVWSHFIPDVDKVLKKHAEEFGAARGVTVRIDTIDLKQFASKKAAEAQAKSGHDIIMNYGADPIHSFPTRRFMKNSSPTWTTSWGNWAPPTAG